MRLFAYVVAMVAMLAALAYFFKPDEAPRVSSTATGTNVAAPAATVPAVPVPAISAPAIGSSAMPASDASAASAAASPIASAVPGAVNAADVVHVDLVYAQGRLVSGPTVVQVKQNDRISLSITSDSADELHLHGINLHLRLKPGQKATLDFVATKTGRFTYELHRADIELGAIEVYPR